MLCDRARFQSGQLELVRRVREPDMWIYHWPQYQHGGAITYQTKQLGTIQQLRTISDARKAAMQFRRDARADPTAVPMTVGEAWTHFQTNELSNPDVERSPTTIQGYKDYFKLYILPQWGSTPITAVRTVKVEDWLRSLKSATVKGKKLAPGTRAKIRNHMSALFSHCARQEWIPTNPIAEVRTSSKRQRIPDVLTLQEMTGILDHIPSTVVRVMVLVAATSAMRRSEIRGLKWKDVDLVGNWFHLQRGVVRKMETNLKTEASRKPVPMLPEMSAVLRGWREETSYRNDEHWVFASPFTGGSRPYWADSILKDHIQPAAVAAGVAKRVGWHTFRHSLGTQLKTNHEDVKTVQELLRHASSRITMDVYVQGNTDAKRAALTGMSSLFRSRSSA